MTYSKSIFNSINNLEDALIEAVNDMELEIELDQNVYDQLVELQGEITNMREEIEQSNASQTMV